MLASCAICLLCQRAPDLSFHGSLEGGRVFQEVAHDSTDVSCKLWPKGTAWQREDDAMHTRI